MKKFIKRLFEKRYTKKDLVSFGNYLLSEKRANMRKVHPEQYDDLVCKGDFYNWENK